LTDHNSYRKVTCLQLVPSGGTLLHNEVARMIVGFRDDWLRDFFVEDVQAKKIPPDLGSRLFRRIQIIDDATSDQDLRLPPSNHFEKLRGDLKGFCSIRVNKRWRLIFQWDGSRGEATGVYLDDHSYQ
jgi:proteic killer suppression protein